MQTMEQLLDNEAIVDVTIWKTKAGSFQCSVRLHDSEGWTVHYGPTRSAALRKALETYVPKPAAKPSFF